MPYVMVGVYGIMSIMTLVYGIYSYVEKKDKRKLLISIICSISIIFVGFLVSEHLSNRQMLLVVIGIVIFNILGRIPIKR